MTVAISGWVKVMLQPTCWKFGSISWQESRSSGEILCDNYIIFQAVGTSYLHALSFLAVKFE